MITVGEQLEKITFNLTTAWAMIRELQKIAPEDEAEKLRDMVHRGISLAGRIDEYRDSLPQKRKEQVI